MTPDDLVLPESFAFTTRLEVRIGEVNYGRHLGNDAMLSLLQEARLRFLAAAGFSELDAGGPSLILTGIAIRFLRQAFHRDELEIGVAAVEPSRCAFALVYRVTRAADGAEIARARTDMACFDYERQKPARMADRFHAAFFPAPAG